MPLVSGVCRAASAPMLSHGGSRLNASKPEANPKTSCPNPGIYMHKKYLVYNELSQKNHTTFCWRKKKVSKFYTFSLFFIRFQTKFYRFFVFRKIQVIFSVLQTPIFIVIFSMLDVWKSLFVTSFSHVKINTFSLDIRPRSFQKTQKHTSIESPLKTEGSSDSLDGTKYIKNSREFFIFEPFVKRTPFKMDITFLKSYVNKRRQKKNIFLWRSFCFSRAKWAIKNPPSEVSIGKNSAKMNIPNHSKEKTPKFCGRKEKDKDLLCFFCTYTKNPFFLLSKRPPTNDRTCMGWHTRHASIHFGAGGTFTSRDAKPNGLESCFGTSFSSSCCFSCTNMNIYINIYEYI